ncbi:glycoside hydrolase/phage tail family protein [Brevundimonas sp.]|uniref:baseplate multidomain protein megatron n=1 Tax=Brevundimonas sp. TaxID=1871086 RepID=UPI0022C57CDD|nr:glycoside hydrolase/phage tail family protein [Brevundimonas sp.]MCZ8195002.1 glycoside hydrolase/phage tail family protein [Brevundimonas sp.]
MATYLLQAAGTYIGGPIGGHIGAFIGSQIDSQAVSALLSPTQKREGPRLGGLQVQASTEGAPIPEVAGGVRLAGQIIWATKLREVATTEQQGGKGSPAGKVQITNYAYFANFAVALCEGVIDSIGRIWADGKPLDRNGVTMRVYRGTADQEPDPLIEGIEGAGKAPAYRGTAYVVFDNLPLEAFGNRLPQLTFEVFRRVGSGASLEELVTAVTIIPGAGERAYDTVVQRRNASLIEAPPENNATGSSDADWTVAIDDLEASLPNVETALLVVGWFGDDLRAGHCTVRPKVEVVEKFTTPDPWRVHGIERFDAEPVTQVDGRPAYGGTPSDDSVVRAVRDLKARGKAVLIYPFIFMDIAPGNSLPNPYGGTGQPAYPWRGRITCHPARGQPGTVDKTGTAATQIAAMFGSVTTSQISVTVDPATGQVETDYSGPDDWGIRRFILHYAKLAAAINAVDPGAVDGILIGSELRGLTEVRSSSTTFPAPAALKTLADDVKAVVGSGVKVSYAADWSEYRGFDAGDGSGDFFFHLDPLWSAASVDFIGVDNYVPLSDWRDGTGHLDALAGAGSVYDRAYLAGNVEGGECYDWFYEDQAARDAQDRTPITDGLGKPWVFRAKDFRNWWLNSHYDRPGGVEASSPTAWMPESKPIWFTEWGVPSVDRGTNQPNVFYDPKSSESFFPHYSRGWRDDLIQARGLEAMLGYWAENNPISSVYGEPMVGLIAVWTWDARPYPYWPARSDLWADGALWPFGHWLKGKIGRGDLGPLVAERCGRVGLTDVDVSGLNGSVLGYLRDRPMSPRGEIEMLMTAFAFDAVESGGVLRFVRRGGAPVAVLTPGDLVAGGEDGVEPYELVRMDDLSLTDEATVGFIDINKDYQSGSVSRSRRAGYSQRTSALQLALAMDEGQAQAVADRTLAEVWVGRETGRFGLPPSRQAIEPCDVISLKVGDLARPFRVVRATDAGARQLDVVRAEASIYGPLLAGSAPVTPPASPSWGPVALLFLDLPMLTDDATPWAPWVAAAATPWGGATLVDSPTGEDFTVDTILPLQATIGETLEPLASGVLWRWDRASVLKVRVFGGALTSSTEAAVLSGANRLAVQNPAGGWEILQFLEARLVADGIYELRGLLRGQLGTEHAMGDPLAAGVPVVVLNGALAQLSTSLTERGLPVVYRWGSSRLPTTNATWRQGSFTNAANGMKPWAPVHVRGGRDAAGNLTIHWIRRTRFGGDSWEGDTPLNEESEAYEVDILDGVTVVRTLIASAPAVTYSAAQQTADFGALPPNLSVAVYQLSATIGRGWPANALI